MRKASGRNFSLKSGFRGDATFLYRLLVQDAPLTEMLWCCPPTPYYNKTEALSQMWRMLCFSVIRNRLLRAWNSWRWSRWTRHLWRKAEGQLLEQHEGLNSPGTSAWQPWLKRAGPLFSFKEAIGKREKRGVNGLDWTLWNKGENCWSCSILCLWTLCFEQEVGETS